VGAGAKKTVKSVPKKKAAAKRTDAADPAVDAPRKQLAAVSAVMKALADPAVDLDHVADMIVKATVRLSGAQNAGFLRRDADGWFAAALHGAAPGTRGDRMTAEPGTLWGRAVLSGRRFHYADTALAEPKLPDAERRRTRMAVPIVRDGESIAVLLMSREDPGGFDKSTIALIETFADQLAVALENARLLKETQDSLERQTATAEILRAISASPTDVQPVLDAIAANAVRYCGAEDALVFLLEAGTLNGKAHAGPVIGGGPDSLPSGLPLDRESLTGHAFIERRTIQVADQEDDADHPLGQKIARGTGHRTMLGTPLLRQGEPIGAILLRRTVVQLFTPQQVELLEAFASQAVIAIENVRLFNETKEALGRQTAISEVLASISRSAFDLDTVLGTIIERAAALAHAETASMYRRDGHAIVTAALDRSGLMPGAAVGQRKPLDDHVVVGRAILERKQIAVADARLDPSLPQGGPISRLGIPIMRDGEAIGAIGLGRNTGTAFTQQEIDLVVSFATQAAIAIENVRLFNETKEALERQTALAEILRVISRSPADVQPVLDAIAESAVRFCAAEDVCVGLLEGEIWRIRAHQGPIEIRLDMTTSRIGPTFVSGRSMIERRTIHVPDLQAAADQYPDGAAGSPTTRAILATPLLSADGPIGALFLRRTQTTPFTERQIDLAETFAAQAVIAIENVRLFNETKEALERQTATSEVLQVISTSTTDVQPVLDAIAAKASALCEAEWALLWLRREDGFHLAAENAAGSAYVEMIHNTVRLASRSSLVGRTALEGRPVHILDVLADPEYEFKDDQRVGGYRTLLGVPIHRDREVVGVIALARNVVRPFSAPQVALVETFASQAVIAIENVRLFTETTESLERQTALGEILQVIASSPTDQQPVLDAIVRSAVRFCGGEDALLVLYSDGQFRTRAHFGSIQSREPDELWSADAHTVMGRAVAEHRTLQSADVLNDPAYPTSKTSGERFGFRAVLTTPLIREGEPIGGLALRRSTPGPFSDRDEELVRAFAAQAVIAMENVRLFNQTQEALERQTAVSEILKVISSSPTDIQPVLEAIASSAARFAAAEDATVMLVRGDVIVPSAHRGPVAMPHATPLDRRSVTGRAILERRTMHSADVTADNEFPHSRDNALKDPGTGQRAVLASPLLVKNAALGAVVLRRQEPIPFTDRQIELVQTFADQAAIAIENVRLFKETQEALERQTATAELLAAMSQSAFDLKPVFEMILEKSLALCQAEYGWIRQFDRDGSSRTVAAKRPDRPPAASEPVDV